MLALFCYFFGVDVQFTSYWSSVLDPYSLNPDPYSLNPDPDPEILVNPVLDPNCC
jgi:hypothetical protein